MKKRITLLPSQRVAYYEKNESSTCYTIDVEEKGNKSSNNTYEIRRESNGNWIDVFLDCDKNTFIEIKESIEKSENNLTNAKRANASQ